MTNVKYSRVYELADGSSGLHPAHQRRPSANPARPVLLPTISNPARLVVSCIDYSPCLEHRYPAISVVRAQDTRWFGGEGLSMTALGQEWRWGLPSPARSLGQLAQSDTCLIDQKSNRWGMQSDSSWSIWLSTHINSEQVCVVNCASSLQ